jgi:hypothetical protein
MENPVRGIKVSVYVKTKPPVRIGRTKAMQMDKTSEMLKKIGRLWEKVRQIDYFKDRLLDLSAYHF